MRTLRITPIDFSQNLLVSVVKNPITRVLNQARTAWNVEQTVFTLSEATKLDLETVESALQQLTRLGVAQPTRKIGSAQAYRFNLENRLHSRLDSTSQMQTGKRRHG